MLNSYRKWLMALWLCGHAALAAAVSDAPLQAMSSYIENSGNCHERVVSWNRIYGPKVLTGETSRSFYYRNLGFIEWGKCGRPFFKSFFAEMQKIWAIFSKGLVTEKEFEAKEAELINLFFAAVENGDRGAELFQRYEGRTAARLIDLEQPKQYAYCTFFGNQPRCLD